MPTVDIPEAGEIARLQSQLAELQQRLETSGTANATLENRIADLEEGLAQWRDDAEGQRTLNEQQKQELQTLRDQIAGLTTQVAAIPKTPAPTQTPALAPTPTPSPELKPDTPIPSPEPPAPSPTPLVTEPKDAPADPPAPKPKAHRLI